MIHWRDGRFSEAEVSLKIDGPAFRFGTGLFETMAYNGKDLCHLDIHLHRLHASLETLVLPHLRLNNDKTAEIITALLEKNGLSQSFARVNLYVFPDALSAPCSVLVTVRSHTPEPDKILRLTLWPDHHITPLAQHKTMNYGFHSLALAQAMGAGFDGAVLTDLDGNLLETTTAALVFHDGKRLVSPSGEPRLPSTALATARTVLDIEEKTIHRSELASFKHAYVLNSLMGMRPLTSIDEHGYLPDETTCKAASKAILLQ